LLGVILRHCVLFPLRLTLLLTSHLVFFVIFFSVKAVWPSGPTKLRVEQRLIKQLAGMYVASFTGVIKFHGPQPMPGGRTGRRSSSSSSSSNPLSSKEPTIKPA
jgi:glycerol-3-phosphate O-acyltransferase 3/4